MVGHGEFDMRFGITFPLNSGKRKIRLEACRTGPGVRALERIGGVAGILYPFSLLAKSEGVANGARDKIRRGTKRRLSVRVLVSH